MDETEREILRGAMLLWMMERLGMNLFDGASSGSK